MCGGIYALLDYRLAYKKLRNIRTGKFISQVSIHKRLGALLTFSAVGLWLPVTGCLQVSLSLRVFTGFLSCFLPCSCCTCDPCAGFSLVHAAAHCVVSETTGAISQASSLSAIVGTARFLWLLQTTCLVHYSNCLNQAHSSCEPCCD